MDGLSGWIWFNSSSFSMHSDQGRDISEKIALGLAKPSMSKDSMFDARLFNQSEGINSGFKDDECKHNTQKKIALAILLTRVRFFSFLAYSLYDKPLFNQGASSIYKFRGKGDDDVLGSTDAEDIERMVGQDKFGMRKGFSGAEGGAGGSSGPVEFEKETIGGRKEKKEDVFGLDTFLNKAKQGKRKGRDDFSDDEEDRKGKRRA